MPDLSTAVSMNSLETEICRHFDLLRPVTLCGSDPAGGGHAHGPPAICAAL
jgi:hypothetical protein